MAQDFMISYKNVSTKLKKRFMKKPNFAEASDEFTQIAKTLANDSCHAYSGLCHMAVARCEQSMSNSSGEIYHLVEAAKRFLQAHEDVALIRCPHCSEHMCSALSCCDTVIKICIAKDMPKDALGLCWELGSWFERNMEYDKAILQYQRCEKLSICNSYQLFLTHKKLLSLHVQKNDFHTALNHGMQMLEVWKTLNPSISTCFPEQSECENTVVLLMMLLNPHPINIKEQHSNILQKYIWSEDTDGFCPSASDDSENCFILMQSLVTACLAKDVAALKYLQNELRSHFTVEQNYLHMKILEEYEHPAGLGF